MENNARTDLISRQVVKDALVERTILEWEQLKTCYPMLEVVDEVPPAQPEIEGRKEESAQNVPNGELISKKAAIDAIFSEPLYKTGMKKRSADEVVPAIFEKIKALPAAQPEQRWVSVTERMPDKKDWYIFSTDKLVWVAFWNGIEWSGGVVSAVLKDIIAWKPFPAPYRKEGEAE